jgi:4'-phosphopantetheinyl transferase
MKADPLSNEIHVWSARLPDSGGSVSQFLSVLSQDEIDRAGRFRQQKDRQRFIVSRGLLRKLLARYANKSAAQLRFAEGIYGKPELLDNESNLRFNLSHSGDRALYAVTREREVGVDVEAENPDLEWVQIARGFFSPIEWNALARLEIEQGRQAFMDLWSRKEALHKAIGAGFSLAADKVPLPLGKSPIQVSAQTLSGADALWSIRHLEAGAGYYAALAVQGEEMSVTCQDVDFSSL